MTSSIWDPANLAILAGALYAVGYLITHQIILRLFILLGSCVYMWYYLVAAETPLWEAIYASVALSVANIIGMTSLLLRNAPISIPRRHRALYNLRFSTMPPGDFRRLVRSAGRVVLDEPEILTREGQPVQALFFVIDGVLSIEKRGERFTVPPGVFVGEIGYLTGQEASATTTLPKGAELLVWEVNRLRLKCRRSPRFKLALDAMISRDLAAKVSFAVAPKNYPLPAQIEVQRQA